METSPAMRPKPTENPMRAPITQSRNVRWKGCGSAATDGIYTASRPTGSDGRAACFGRQDTLLVTLGNRMCIPFGPLALTVVGADRGSC
jgi:hypothetical protein